LREHRLPGEAVAVADVLFEPWGDEYRGAGPVAGQPTAGFGLVKSIADLYTLTEDQLLTLERMERMSGSGTAAQIANSKQAGWRVC